MGLSEFRAPYSGVLIIRILLFRVLYYIRVPYFRKVLCEQPLRPCLELVFGGSLDPDPGKDLNRRSPYSRRDATKECCSSDLLLGSSQGSA